MFLAFGNQIGFMFTLKKLVCGRQGFNQIYQLILIRWTAFISAKSRIDPREILIQSHTPEPWIERMIVWGMLK